MASTEYPGYFDKTSVLTTVCASLASYNALELIVLIFTTFQHYHGLYFWSIFLASVSIVPYITGMLMMYFGSSTLLAGLIVNNGGWITMIVSQSVVLYSRLGIVLRNQQSKILVSVKWMIIVDAIVFYLLASTTVFGMHYSDNPIFGRAYIYTERLQMTGFCAQEFIISGLYIWHTLDILKAGEKKEARQTLMQLLTINVVIVGLDVALLVLEYLGLSSIQIAFKPLVYSCKLKMEFAILSKLVESSTFAQRKTSTSLSRTATMADAMPHASASRRLTASSLAGDGGCSDAAACSQPSLFNPSRNSSHQPENSQRLLINSHHTLSRPTETAMALDSYHCVVRAMSTTLNMSPAPEQRPACAL